MTAAMLLCLVLVLATMSTLGLAAGKPEAFDWRDSPEHGNRVSAVRNFMGLAGHNCSAAGGVFAATAMLADRLAVLQPRALKVMLSNQVIINCLDGDACTDPAVGTIEAALRYVADHHGVPDRTCMGDRGAKGTCARLNTCINCVPVPKVVCEPRPKYFKYPIENVRKLDVADAAALRREIRDAGPVACALRDGGFGVAVGFRGDAFAVKHDLGTAFGDRGFTEVSAGALRECWAADVLPRYRYHDEAAALALQPRPFLTNDGHKSKSAAGAAPARLRREWGELVLSAPPRALSLAELPRNFSWLDVDGRAVLTPVQSHHNGPGYCGACYAMASASVLSDRVKLQRGGFRGVDAFISPQNTVDCVRGPMSDGCHGGDSRDVFPRWQADGTVEESCNVWRNEEQPCMQRGRGCRVCDADGSCRAADAGSFDVYKISEWGVVRGEQDMMNEIMHRGPIDCGIATPPALGEDFVGEDILCDHDTPPSKWEITHDISVVGWGETAAGHKYWVIRNSWGTHWGDGGMAKVCRGQNAPDGNMMLESLCSWVVPEKPAPAA